MQVLFKELSDNLELTVYDTAELYGEKGSFRVLQFSDEAVQGAMDLQHPERIVLEYPRAIIHLMEYNDPSFEDVFIIGHGIGTIAGHFAGKRIKAAELDAKVVEVSRTYFGFRNDNVVVGDGRRILESEAPQVYDYIVLDAFTDKGTPRHLISREFFRMTREKLAPQGFIMMNLFGKGETDRLITAVHTTLGEEYAYTKSFALPGRGAADVQNMILAGGNRPIGYQARHMAGFTEIALGPGHTIWDRDPRPKLE